LAGEHKTDTKTMPTFDSLKKQEGTL